MRIGLVMGAGGAVGASYLTGALEGIRRATGFEPRDADLLVGTSAGACIGSLATTMPVALLYAQCAAEIGSDALSELDRARAAEIDRPNRGSFWERFPPAKRMPRPLLSSPRAVLKGLVSPHRTTLEMFVTGMLGEGLVATDLIGAIVSAAHPRGWPRERLWVTALELDSGRRVVLRSEDERARRDAPIDLATAIRAATAVPGVFAPVTIRGRRHIDAGVWSLSNLDVVEGERLDAVLCINPSSGGTLERGAGSYVSRALDRVQRIGRARADARLERERARVERSGTPVFVLHPSAEDLASFPHNYLDVASRERIVRLSARTVERRIREHGELARVLRDAAGTAHPATRAAG